MTIAAAVEAGIDDERPNAARMYDYYLGGAHNFAVDREHAARVSRALPQSVPWARANRHFLRHAVAHAAVRGIDQYLDLGSGIPTVGNVHEEALRHAEHARTAYVDNEPVAVAHSEAVLADEPLATITRADLRDADAVLTAAGVARHLDLSRPVALLALAVLHFVADTDDPAGILARYRQALAPGSLLAMSHASFDYPEHPGLRESREALFALYATTSNPVVDRSRAEITAIVERAGFRLNADGLVPIDRWATTPADEPLGGYGLLTEPVEA